MFHLMLMILFFFFSFSDGISRFLWCAELSAGTVSFCILYTHEPDYSVISLLVMMWWRCKKKKKKKREKKVELRAFVSCWSAPRTTLQLFFFFFALLV